MAKAKTTSSMKGIYVLMESKGENRRYVGSSLDLDTRLGSYYNKQRGKRIIDHSINKYGFDSFIKYIIPFEDSITEYELRMWEGFYIKLFASYHYEFEDGMNLVDKPNLCPSKHKEVKQKISESCKGIKKEWLSERNKGNKYSYGRTGELHPLSKKVINLQTRQIFNSIKDAGDFYGVSRTTMRYRIKRNLNEFKYL